MHFSETIGEETTMASSGGTGACSGHGGVRREVRWVEVMSNHLLRELGVAFSRQGSVAKVSSVFPTASRSRRA